jgi:dihydrofolate reductase
MTLDGVMQAPGGPGEDPTGGFSAEGWSVNYWDEMMGEVMTTSMAKPFELLLGRKTYDIFAAHWPYSTEPGADTLNNAKKYVASRTLTKVEWNNSTLLKGDVVQEIRKLKEHDGPELSVLGSSNFIQTLLKSELVDAFDIWIFPVVIGRGKRLFDQGTLPANLKLTDTKISSTGVIITTYLPDGKLITGTFELEHPSQAELERRERLRKES